MFKTKPTDTTRCDIACATGKIERQVNGWGNNVSYLEMVVLHTTTQRLRMASIPSRECSASAGVRRRTAETFAGLACAVRDYARPR